MNKFKVVCFTLLMCLSISAYERVSSAKESEGDSLSEYSNSVENKDSSISRNTEIRKQYELDERKDIMTFKQYQFFIESLENSADVKYDTPKSKSTSQRNRIVAEAQKHLGKPYVWGGKGPDKFDCSGLTRYVYLQVTGKNIGNSTVPQESSGSIISVSEAQVGDLYFWGSRGSTYHVAIATGNGGYIHAATPELGVIKGTVSSYRPDFAVRILPKEVPTQQINKYLTLTRDGQDFFGNTDCTIKKGKTARGRIYYTKIAYKLNNGQLLYSVYTDEKATEWLGYLKEGASEFTSIQTFNKKRVTLVKNSATLWKDLNYKGKMGTSVSGENYTVNRIFYNSTNKAYYHELYKGNAFCGYINSAFVKDLTSQPINKYITLTKGGQDIFGDLEGTSKKSKTELGRIYYTKIAYNLGNGQLLYSIYVDDKATEWLGYLKEGAFEFTSIQTFNKKRVTLVNNSATLWKDLNYKGKMGISVAGDNYTVNRIFYNSTNKAYYHELYKGNIFCGYINSAFVKDLTSQPINKYITLTKGGQDIFGDLEGTGKKGKTELGRIYYTKIAYNLGNGQLLYSIYTDDKATEWLGYLKEGASEFTSIQTFNKKRVTLVNSSATLWKDLNYKGKMGTSIAGENYTVNRIFYNSTNKAYYHELYKGDAFCGYINSAFVKDLTSQPINKYITLTKGGQDIFGDLEGTSKKGKTELGRIYYTKIAYNLGNGQLLYSVYTDDKATEWIGYLKEVALEFTQIQSFDKKQVTINKNGYTLWKDLNYKGKMGISVLGDNYIVNRVFYNSTNKASYYELYKEDGFYGYINSEAVQDFVENNSTSETKTESDSFSVEEVDKKEPLEMQSSNLTESTDKINYLEIPNSVEQEFISEKN